MTIHVKGLHHNAYRCSDSEQTRQFYEDFLGLKLANAFKIETTHTGRGTGAGVLHSFYEMGDGSFLAFFLPAYVCPLSDCFLSASRRILISLALSVILFGAYSGNSW